MPPFFGPPIPNWLTHPSRLFKHQQLQHEPLVSIFNNVVYYPNWRIYRQQPPSSLSLGYISHVIYAFARVNPDGEISLTDEFADTKIEVDGTTGCLNALNQLKQQYPQLRTLLSIGGGGENSTPFPGVAADHTARLKFAYSARMLVDTYGLNGIDIDWEHPANALQGHHYIQLLAALRESLPSPTFILTSALPAGEWALQNINLAQASVYLDFINLMTYDFSGPWTNTCGHHAQLNTPTQPHSGDAILSCRSAVMYMRSKGVPSAKIHLGIPVYGRSFLGATKIGDAYVGQGGEEGTFEYQNLPRPGAQEWVDEQVGAAFCVGGDGGFVTYDNPQTVQLKAQFVRQQRLAGIFYWTGTADTKGPRSLVEAGYNSLHDL